MLKTKGIGPLKTFTVTQAAFENVTLETPVTIPTSDTTTYGRTLEVADFPTYSFPPESVKYIEHCSVYGYNNSGGAITVYWKSYKNSVEVSSGNLSVNNLNYFTAEAFFYDVSAGDLCEVSVWASANTNVTINGHVSHISPTKILPTSKDVVDVTEIYTYEAPTVGSASTLVSRVEVGICEGLLSSSPQTITSFARSFVSSNSYGVFKYGRGDVLLADNGQVSVTATAGLSPRLGLSHIPTSITYRELNEGKL